MPRRARPGRQLAAPLTGSGGELPALPPGAVGRGGWIPCLPGGDDRVQLPQDRGGDDGLGLGGRELVLVPAGQVLVAGPVYGAGALGSPDGAPGCLATARAVANRPGSPVSAKIAAAPTGDRPVIEVASAVRPSSPRTAVIRCSVSASRSLLSCQSST